MLKMPMQMMAMPSQAYEDKDSDYSPWLAVATSNGAVPRMIG